MSLQVSSDPQGQRQSSACKKKWGTVPTSTHMRPKVCGMQRFLASMAKATLSAQACTLLSDDYREQDG